jgi:hypothetical protein
MRVGSWVETTTVTRTKDWPVLLKRAIASILA